MTHRNSLGRALFLTLAVVLPALGANPVYTAANAPMTPPLEDLALCGSVSRHGITWRFADKARVGRFVNGDYYVVGPVTVASVEPAPAKGRNQSCLNLPVTSVGASPFDSRVAGGRGKVGAKLRAAFPLEMKPGDALISSISTQPRSIPDFLRPSDKNLSPVGSVSILTCLAEPAPADAFRPSYGDRAQTLYLARNLRRELLPGLPRDGLEFRHEQGPIELADFAAHFERPWLDICFFHFDAPAQYQVQYGREGGRAVGIAALLLCLDFTPEELEPLLVNVVQYGVDLWGVVRAGSRGWQAHGGHGTGRKLPIVFAGLMLGDPEMAAPTKAFPKLRFGEDMQTMFDNGWTGAKAVYAGHVGKGGVKGKADWGAYEHLPPAEWPGRLGENYRRCCTSVAWVGQALAMRLLHAEKPWNHDAFFAYVDRWMTEDDTGHIEQIKKAKGWDYSASWQRQGQAWDPFVNHMWALYRNHLPPAPDGHADPPAEGTWR
ncbi:MAG: hypothetical protein JXR37_23190 [Kiritimatiellae bacterium]|nr:hypothetical protein [Kiritimatiellia bacterium]